jgi:hypothetical protein
MTAKPTRPVRKKVTGRKPKPVTLNRVPNEDPGHFRYGIPGQTRFTVRRDFPRWTIPVYAVWDKQRDDWLYPDPMTKTTSRKQYDTRAAAWRYLKTTTVEDREYRLEMLNRAFDKDAA